MHNQVTGYKHPLGSNLCLAKQIQPTCLTTARLPICPNINLQEQAQDQNKTTSSESGNSGLLRVSHLQQ